MIENLVPAHFTMLGASAVSICCNDLEDSNIISGHSVPARSSKYWLSMSEKDSSRQELMHFPVRSKISQANKIVFFFSCLFTYGSLVESRTHSGIRSPTINPFWKHLHTSSQRCFLINFRSCKDDIQY